MHYAAQYLMQQSLLNIKHFKASSTLTTDAQIIENLSNDIPLHYVIFEFNMYILAEVKVQKTHLNYL